MKKLKVVNLCNSCEHEWRQTHAEEYGCECNRRIGVELAPIQLFQDGAMGNYVIACENYEEVEESA